MFVVTEPRHIPQPIHATSTVQLMPFGSIVRAYDNIQGAGEFMYLGGVASTAVGNVMTAAVSTGVVTRFVTAPNSGRAFYIAMAAHVANQFGWYQISGTALATTAGTGAAGGVAYTVGTSTVTSAATTGNAILGSVIVAAEDSTFTKVGTVRNGSTSLVVPDFDGLAVGLTVSGTGIPGATLIAAGVDGSPNATGGTPGGSGTIIMSAAGTADGTVTVTFTRNNFCTVSSHRYGGTIITA